jgi:cysteine desulfurase
MSSKQMPFGRFAKIAKEVKSIFQFRRKVYLDSNATTKVAKEVVKAMEKCLSQTYGNPSSLYLAARDAAMLLSEARQKIAAAINAKPTEITFTSCASEANNQILKSVSEYFLHSNTGRHKIVASPIEHSSVMETLGYLTKHGVQVEFCPVDNKGRLILTELEALVDDHTFLVCALYANNETGVLQNIPKIVKIAEKHQALVMVDSVQALGKIPLDVQALGIDYATFSAHKIHGPKGIGALFAKEGAPLGPFIHGGHQESGLRAGTEALHNIVGFAEAATKIPELLEKGHSLNQLKQYFINELQIINSDIIINSPLDGLPNTLSITFPGIPNAVLMAVLDSYGISVSAGSACDTQEDKPSHVLTALGLSPKEARETLRFSLSDQTTSEDLAYVLGIIKAYIEGSLSTVQAITPGQLDPSILLNPKTYILDVRFSFDRKAIKSLSNSYEAGFFNISKYIHLLPHDKNILVICQDGYNSAVAAYYLKSKGFKNTSFIIGGLRAWRLFYADLYAKYTGQNITTLQPRR